MHTIEPVTLEPFSLDFGWIEPGRGHYRLYHGAGSAAAIDYHTPVTVTGDQEMYATVPVAMSAGQRQFLAARAVSSAGIEEQNSHVVCCAEIDKSGNLLAPPLARVEDLTAEVLPGRVAAVGFSYEPPAGYAAAESFEVFGDGGTGRLDLDNPLVVVPAAGRDYQVLVPAAALPARFAVRARAGGRAGPLSVTLFVCDGAPIAPRIIRQAAHE